MRLRRDRLRNAATRGAHIHSGPSKRNANLSLLEHVGIHVPDQASEIFTIEGLELRLSTGFWRSDDGKVGYDVRSFIAEWRRRKGSAALLPKLSL